MDQLLRALFDPVCHQIAARSFGDGDAAMALCARCAGLYLGVASVVLWLAALRMLRWRPRVPATERWLIPAGAAACVVDALTGASYALLAGNVVRLLLGFSLGMVLTWLLSAWMWASFAEGRGAAFVDRGPAVFRLVALALAATLLASLTAASVFAAMGLFALYAMSVAGAIAIVPRLATGSAKFAGRIFTGLLVVIVASAAPAADLGDGRKAVKAILQPAGLALDDLGNLYIADALYHRVRKVSLDGRIATVAGNGIAGFGGDGGLATEASLFSPQSVAADRYGNLLISDSKNQRIRKVAPDGTITTLLAGLGQPRGVTVDAVGNLFFADELENRVYRVDVDTGVITTVAGNGTRGVSADGMPADQAMLNAPIDVAVDGNGDLFILEGGDGRVRRVRAETGLISTVAGSQALQGASGVEIDGRGNLFVAEKWASRIRLLSTAEGTTINGGTMGTLAGTVDGFAGDGGKAVEAKLSMPSDVAVNRTTGDLFIADTNNGRVRRIDSQGVISTFAGTGGLPGGRDPFLNRFAYVLFLAATLAATILACWRLRRKWNEERARVRSAIVSQVGKRVAERVLGIVPATGIRENEPKAESPFWLCFLSDRIISFRGGTSEIETVHLRDLVTLELIEGSSDRPSLAVKTRDERSALDGLLLRTSRVDDMVRVINILIQQGIALKYRRVG